MCIYINLEIGEFPLILIALQSAWSDFRFRKNNYNVIAFE